MKLKVYLETSVVSYLAARPSRDIIVAAHQELTRHWWEQERNNYHLTVSEVVMREVSAGNPEMAAQRLQILKGIDVLEISEEALSLAEELVKCGAVPVVASEDAMHIAVAVTNGVEYLLTWNFSHIANAKMRRAIDAVCVNSGYRPMILCTPEELTEEMGK